MRRSLQNGNHSHGQSSANLSRIRSPVISLSYWAKDNRTFRVKRHHNGRLLADTENANLKVVELFCLLHDTQRRNEDRDPEHGSRAADYAQAIRGTLFELNEEEMELLDEALRYHSDGYVDADITVQVCWDADRLDLGRVGIRPSYHKLCTASAKSERFIEAAYRRSRSFI